MEPCARRSRDGVFARTALISVAFALFFSLAQLASARPLLDFAGDTGVPSVPVETGGQHVLTGSIAQTDQTWSCRGPVDLDSVTVTMTTAISSRRGADAIHLEPGCTGRIRHLVVLTAAADAVKVVEGVHDLAIDSGSVVCTAKLPTMHQDGIQVMGGERITLRGLSVNCGRSGQSLINSNLFINQAGRRAIRRPTSSASTASWAAPRRTPRTSSARCARASSRRRSAPRSTRS